MFISHWVSLKLDNLTFRAFPDERVNFTELIKPKIKLSYGTIAQFLSYFSALWIFLTI